MLRQMPAVPSPVRVGLRAAVLVGAILAVLQLSGAIEPVDLLAAGRDGYGGDVMVEDFGSASIRDGVPFDGQYIYVTARELPDLDQLAEADEASYRLVRILHPLLASPGGSGTPVIILLELWGVVGVALLTWAMADILARYGQPAELALAAAAACGLALILTTSEPLGFGLAMAGLALVDRDRLVAGASLLALGGLTRESALTIAVAAAVLLWTRGQRKASGLVLAAAVAPTAAWWAYVQSITPRSRVPLEPLGILHLADRWWVDIVASVIVLLLLVIAVVAWWDIPPLRWVALGFAAWLPLYESVAFKVVGIPRLSIPAVALGLAGALRLIRRPLDSRDGLATAS